MATAYIFLCKAEFDQSKVKDRDSTDIVLPSPMAALYVFQNLFSRSPRVPLALQHVAIIGLIVI